MTKAEKDMLDYCDGDMVTYNNWVCFADFMCRMIRKYGDKVLAEISKGNKDVPKEADNK